MREIKGVIFIIDITYSEVENEKIYFQETKSISIEEKADSYIITIPSIRIYIKGELVELDESEVEMPKEQANLYGGLSILRNSDGILYYDFIINDLSMPPIDFDGDIIHNLMNMSLNFSNGYVLKVEFINIVYREPINDGSSGQDEDTFEDQSQR